MIFKFSTTKKEENIVVLLDWDISLTRKLVQVYKQESRPCLSDMHTYLTCTGKVCDTQMVLCLLYR